MGDNQSKEQLAKNAKIDAAFNSMLKKGGVTEKPKVKPKVEEKPQVVEEKPKVKVEEKEEVVEEGEEETEEVAEEEDIQPVPVPVECPDGMDSDDYLDIIESTFMYESGGSQKGPVEWKEFVTFVSSGVVGRSTRILGGIMDDFKRYELCPDIMKSYKYYKLKNPNKKKGKK